MRRKPTLMKTPTVAVQRQSSYSSASSSASPVAPPDEHHHHHHQQQLTTATPPSANKSIDNGGGGYTPFSVNDVSRIFVKEKIRFSNLNQTECDVNFVQSQIPLIGVITPDCGIRISIRIANMYSSYDKKKGIVADLSASPELPELEILY